MRFGKVIFAFFILAFVFSLAEIHAQKANSSKQIKILNNYGSIPFEDGKTIIAEVKFTGLDSDYEKYDEAIGNIIRESEFRDILRGQRVIINADDKFYGYKVSKAVKLLREWLSSEGYVKAEVVALGEKLPKNQMRLIFVVKRDVMVRVSEIRFVGNRNISNEEYVNNLKQCSGNSWRTYDNKKYDFYTQKCSRDLMFSKGYVRGKVNLVSPKLEGNFYIVTVEVEEGTRYLFGEIKIKGAKVFTEKELLEMLNLKTGDMADAPAIRDFLYVKLKRVYADRGYLLFESEFDPEFIEPQAEGLDGVLNTNAEIYEGKPLKISKIVFGGINLDDDTKRQLKDEFSLKEGEVFNQSKLEEEIKKINKTEKFYPIDHESDVEIRISEDYNDVELLIKAIKIE